MNSVKNIENYTGEDVKVQLEGIKDTDDITHSFLDTEYKGVRGLKIRILMDGLSKDTDMGEALDNIYLLEKNTDF